MVEACRERGQRTSADLDECVEACAECGQRTSADLDEWWRRALSAASAPAPIWTRRCGGGGVAEPGNAGAANFESVTATVPAYAAEPRDLALPNSSSASSRLCGPQTNRKLDSSSGPPFAHASSW
jgi:hypothetical protein